MPETSSKFQIQKNYDLSKNSTLRVKATAEQLVIPKSIAELQEIFIWIKSQGLSWNILGATSNNLKETKEYKNDSLGMAVFYPASFTLTPGEDRYLVRFIDSVPNSSGYKNSLSVSVIDSRGAKSFEEYLKVNPILNENSGLPIQIFLNFRNICPRAVRFSRTLRNILYAIISN